MAQKKTIYYSRTYRKIHTNFLHASLYLFFVVLPVLVILLLNLDTITYMLSELAQKILSAALPEKTFEIMESNFVPFGSTYCISFDSRFPSGLELMINLAVVSVIIAILILSSMRGKPLTVYLLFSFMVHIVSCVYFIFERDSFVYTATEFSDIFIKQQISIWILFVVMMGIITAFVGSKGLLSKFTAFFALLIYSGMFGTVRYIIYMFILARFSILYMADMYFVVGPIFDFLYLVGIYAVFTDRMQKRLDSPAGEEEWQWL